MEYWGKPKLYNYILCVEPAHIRAIKKVSGNKNERIKEFFTDSNMSSGAKARSESRGASSPITVLNNPKRREGSQNYLAILILTENLSPEVFFVFILGSGQTNAFLVPVPCNGYRLCRI